MQKSDNIGQLAAALAKAQGEFPPIVKDRTANIRSEKGAYTYHYADLASVLESVKPALAKHEIAIAQPCSTDGTKVTVTTWLVHKSGEWMCSDSLTVVAESARPQAIGSAATYARRYSLAGMLGIAPEEDDDGAAAETSGRVHAAPDTRSLRERVQATADELGGEVVETLNRAKQQGVFVFDFGKHSGRSVTEVPASYLEWLKEKCADELAGGESKDPARAKRILDTVKAELSRRDAQPNGSAL